MRTRGVNNEAFKVNLKEIIRNHNPCLVALLETKMTNHACLKNEFAFDEMFEVPALGHSGGLVLILYSHFVHVTRKQCTDQEVHSMIQSFRLLSKKLGDPALNHNIRQANSVADSLCKMGVNLPSNQVQLLLTPPSRALSFLAANILHVPLTRLVSRSSCNYFASLGNPSILSSFQHLGTQMPSVLSSFCILALRCQ
ncbi:hypothetical protein P3S67_028603 [Capsicum chacoense]